MIGFLFSFQGRINRRPLWGYWLFSGALGLAILYAIYWQVMRTPLPADMTPEDFAARMEGANWLNLLNLALIWPSLAIGVKRCHVRGRSGWFLLLLLVPLLNFWPIIELAFVRGTTGENRFGPDPLEGAPQDGWKSWAIFLGFVAVFALQAALGFNLFVVMQSHMPKMKGPGMEMPATPNPAGLRPSTAT